MATIREVWNAQTFGDGIFYKTSTSKSRTWHRIPLSWSLRNSWGWKISKMVRIVSNGGLSIGSTETSCSSTAVLTWSSFWESWTPMLFCFWQNFVLGKPKFNADRDFIRRMKAITPHQSGSSDIAERVTKILQNTVHHRDCVTWSTTQQQGQTRYVLLPWVPCATAQCTKGTEIL